MDVLALVVFVVAGWEGAWRSMNLTSISPLVFGEWTRGR